MTVSICESCLIPKGVGVGKVEAGGVSIFIDPTEMSFLGPPTKRHVDECSKQLHP